MRDELTIRFHARCAPALALQRLSTVISHQRAPLLSLTLDGPRGLDAATAGDDSGDDAGGHGPTATIALKGLTTPERDQLLRRLRREWSIASVAPAWSGRDVACPGQPDVVSYGRDAAHSVGRNEDGDGHG